MKNAIRNSMFITLIVVICVLSVVPVTALFSRSNATFEVAEYVVVYNDDDLDHAWFETRDVAEHYAKEVVLEIREESLTDYYKASVRVDKVRRIETRSTVWNSR
jgi:hypothetical protein